MRRFLETAFPMMVLWSALAAVFIIGLFVSLPIQLAIVDMFINVVLVVGLYVFMGNSGVFSFGQMSYMAVGAYSASLLSIPTTDKHFLLPGLPHFLAVAELSTVPAIIVGGIVAAVFALVTGTVLMRLSGIAAGIGTFALLIITQTVALNWTSVTGGALGMDGMPVDTTMESAFIWALVCIVCAFVFQRSSFGVRLRASRDDIVAARSVGIKVARERTIAFVVSGFFTGVAGGLYAHFLGAISPDAFYLELTFLIVAMLIVGGRASLSGAVIGTLVISGLAQVLLELESGVQLGPLLIQGPSGIREVGIGVSLILVLILRPAGIMGGSEISWPRGDRGGGRGPLVAMMPPWSRRAKIVERSQPR